MKIYLKWISMQDNDDDNNKSNYELKTRTLIQFIKRLWDASCTRKFF